MRGRERETPGTRERERAQRERERDSYVERNPGTSMTTES